MQISTKSTFRPRGVIYCAREGINSHNSTTYLPLEKWQKRTKKETQLFLFTCGLPAFFFERLSTNNWQAIGREHLTRDDHGITFFYPKTSLTFFSTPTNRIFLSLPLLSRGLIFLCSLQCSENLYNAYMLCFLQCQQKRLSFQENSYSMH